MESMKKLIKLGMLAGIMGALILPISAKITNTNQPTESTLQTTQQDEQAKGELYQKFLAKFNAAREQAPTNADAAAATYKEAIEIAREYLQKYPNDKDQIAEFLRKKVDSYDAEQQKVKVAAEKEARKKQVIDLLYTQKKYKEGYDLGKQVLAEDAEDLATLVNLSNLGTAAVASNESLRADAINYTKRSIQMIEAGKSLDGKPFPEKEKTLGSLYYSLGVLSKKTSPNDAIASLHKAAQFEEAKKNPVLYAQLADIYAEMNAKPVQDYKAMYEGKPESPESIAALKKINDGYDLIIDAYARAVAYSGNDPKYAEPKKGWMDQLTALYKYRNNDSDAGLKELIVGVMAKPLPVPGSTTATSASSSNAATPTSSSPTDTNAKASVNSSTTTNTGASTSSTNTGRP
jgi:hypothetical protein